MALLVGHGLVALGVRALGAPVVGDAGLRGEAGARQADQPREGTEQQPNVLVSFLPHPMIYIYTHLRIYTPNIQDIYMFTCIYVYTCKYVCTKDYEGPSRPVRVCQDLGLVGSLAPLASAPMGQRIDAGSSSGPSSPT